MTILLFLLALAFFVHRGPYRAIRHSTTGDFATVYGAARCWLAGVNPYENESLKRELAKAGAPESVRQDQDVNPSVYLPSALLWMALIAWMPWQAANVVWCVLSLLLWALALRAILAATKLKARGKWFVAAAALLFSPTYVGIYDGNPSVITISLVTLAVLDASWARAAIFLATALCFKPQIALCGLILFFLWKKWRVLAAALLVFAICMAVGSLRNRSWLQTERHNVAVSFEPGGQSDPAPGSHVAWQFLNAQTLAAYVTSDRQVWDAVVWALGAVLAILFLALTRNSRPPWQTAAFFAALTLLLTYHRYYDAQLLLLAIPFLVELWRSRGRFVVAVICLLVLAFPIQSLFARRLGTEAQTPSAKQALLLRNQPAAVLLLACLFAWPLRREEEC